MNADLSALSFSVRNVSFRIETRAVLNNISFSIFPNERVLLLGANGAGKSTLLKLCAGLCRPHSGEIGLGSDGAVLRAVPAARFGYFGHAPMVYGDLSVRQNLRLFAALRAVSEPAADLLSSWGLERFADRPVRELSQGYRNRLAFVLSTVHRPEMLFLDEPTTALDEESCARLMEAARSAMCALVATHDTHRLLPWATRALLLNQGEVAADSTALGSNWREAILARYLEVNR